MDKSVVFSLNGGGDDDAGWGNNLKVVDNGSQADDAKWLQDICASLEKKFDEYNRNVMARSDAEGSSSKNVVKECEDDDCVILDDNDDDDCVILDGDPDKVGVEGQNVAVGDDDDELVIVGETGQVACRDYPHPRELCAKLPFSSTPHEQYCNQCHCYVCDAPAPCLKWGTGISVSDHCHATEKVQFWKQQRDSLKKSHQSTVHVPEVQCTSMSTQPIQTNQAPASTPLIPPYNIPIVHDPVSPPIPSVQYQTTSQTQIPYNIPSAQDPVSPPIPSIQYLTSQTQIPIYNIPPAQDPVSPPINPSIQYQTSQTQAPRPTPNTSMQYQAFQAQTTNPALVWPSRKEAMNMPISNIGQSYVLPRNNLQLNFASPQSRNTGNNALARNGRHNVGSLGPRVNVPHAAMFKRSGTPGIASTSNQRTGNLINGHGSIRFTNIPDALAALHHFQTTIYAPNNRNSNMSGPSLQPYMQPMSSNIMPFHSQLQSQLFSQSSVATTSSNLVPNRPLFDPSSRSHVVVYSTTQPQIPSSQRAYVGLSRPVLPQPQVPLQLSLPNSSGTTVPFEPSVSTQPSHASNSQQNVFQLQNQTNNTEQQANLSTEFSSSSLRFFQ